MSTSAWKRTLSAFFALSIVAAAGCGSDGAPASTGNTTGPASVLGTSYTGVLEDGSVVTLVFPQTSALVADRAATSSTVNVSGEVIAANGTKYTVTGTYDSSNGAFSVSGAGWTLSGTYTNGTIQGTYSGPNGSGGFVAGNITAVTKYCGTYLGSGESGRFMVLATGQKAFLVVNGRVLEGTISGATIAFTLTASATNPGINVSGTISGPSVNGTWSVTDGSGTSSGTWTGSSTGCPTATGTVSAQCNAISGTWSVGATSGEMASNATCGAILAAAGGSIGRPATVTVTVSGNAVSVGVNGDTLTGTLDPNTCKVSLSTPISDTVSVGGTSVAITGTQRNDITFNSNSSLTNAWTVTIDTATGQSGLPCTVTATQTGAKP